MNITIFYNDGGAVDKLENVKKVEGHTDPNGMMVVLHGKGEYMGGVCRYATLYVPMRRVSKIAVAAK